MTHGFIESDDGGLRYEEKISVALRLFVDLIGAGMFIIPAPFLQHAHLGMSFWQWLLIAPCIVAPSLLGLLFLAIALCRTLRLCFDMDRRQMLRTSRWPLNARWRAVDYALITRPRLLERSSEDGPFYVISLRVRGDRWPMHLSGFESREEAEQWRLRIAAQLRNSGTRTNFPYVAKSPLDFPATMLASALRRGGRVVECT